MEEAGSDPDEAPELPEPSDEEKAADRSDQMSSVEVSEALKKKKSHNEEEKEEEEDRLTKLIHLQKHLTLSVTNVQTAADVKELEQRREWEAARSIRLEQLENDVRSSQEKCEEITKGWSLFDQRSIPDEMRTTLDGQKQLCAAILQDKDKLINDLQQELKKKNACYVKNLKKNAEEIDLMTERMEEQVKILNKAYTEEMADTERAFLEEIEILISEDKIKMEQDLKAHWDKELERLMTRRKTVEDYEAQLKSLMFNNMQEESVPPKNQMAKLKAQQKTRHEKPLEELTARASARAQETGPAQITEASLFTMKRRITRSRDEIIRIKNEISELEKGLTKKAQRLSSDYIRQLQRYERLQQQAKHFERADARQFQEVWQTIDEEVKQLVGRALELDSLICRRHLGLDWKPPPMPFMEVSGPVASPKGPVRSEAWRSGWGGASSWAGSSPETECGTEVEEEELSVEALQAVMELLCDEAGFLVEDHLLKLLSPFAEDERPGVKHGSLLSSLGIEDKDVPKLAAFLLKYGFQQRQQRQDVCGCQDAEAAEDSQRMDRNDVLLALRSFLEQHRKSRRGSQSRQTGFWHVEAYDAPKAKAYWESLANVIPEEKMRLWEESEITLRKYQSVLMDIDEIASETEKLQQQNTELRTLLQQRLSGTVD